MNGAQKAKVLAAEKRIAAVRLLVILSGLIIYPLFMDKAGTVPWLAYTLLATASIYGLYVYYYEPYKRYSVLLSSYFTSGTDAGFTMLWLYATGGFESPFYVALYMAVVAVAFRFGFQETAFAAATYAVAYLAMLGLLGELFLRPVDVLVRVVYIFLASAMGYVVSREVSEQTESRLRMQDLMLAAQRAEAQVREAKTRLEEAQRIARLGSWEWDLGTNRVVWSDEMYRIYGYKPGGFPVNFEKAMERVRRDDVPVIQANVERALQEFKPPESAAPGVEYRIVLPDGTERFLYGEGRIQADAEGRPAIMRGTVHDVTERKQAEEARSAALGQAQEIERLQELNRFKTQFINTSAHELQTPLTPIKLEAHMLTQRWEQLSAADRRKAMEILARNVDRMALLVKDLLEAARIQAERLGLSRKPTSLSGMVREAVETFRAQADQQKVRLDAKPGPDLTVDVDDRRIVQVLYNLLSNALKFTPAGGRVWVETRSDGDSVQVSVHDTGIGLTPEQRALLFRPFSQVHTEAPHPRPGTGLGLYISRGIVELHGGTLTCTSPGPNQGSVFLFTLPRAVTTRADAIAAR